MTNKIKYGSLVLDKAASFMKGLRKMGDEYLGFIPVRCLGCGKDMTFDEARHCCHAGDKCTICGSDEGFACCAKLKIRIDPNN